MKTVNLEEIINTLPSFCIGYKNSIKDAMKEACRQTLELAAENAKHLWDNNENELFDIDKQSILDTINQIQ